MIASAIAIAQAARKAPGMALCVIGAVLALCGLSFFWGLGIGHKAGDGKVSAQQLRQAEDNLATAVQANKDMKAEMARGERAAKALRDELDQRDKRIKDLTWRLKDVPKFVATPSCPAPGAVHLSVAAVQLYDAALAGGEGGQLPGGACGAAEGGAGTGDAAGRCEQASAVDLRTFQEVAQANAVGFGECHIRLRALIQHVMKRQAGAAIEGDEPEH
jgi:hypothetical protein